MTLQEATAAYQAELERVRAVNTNGILEGFHVYEELVEIDEDLARARKAMEVAWLNHTTGMAGHDAGHGR